MLVVKYHKQATLAQLVERVTRNDKVLSSILGGGSSQFYNPFTAFVRDTQDSVIILIVFF